MNRSGVAVFTTEGSAGFVDLVGFMSMPALFIGGSSVTDEI
jgi:hypothetical protein